MKSFSGFQALAQSYHHLAQRDKVALWALGIFLFLFSFGYGGWELHQKANASQKAYDDTVADLFWLRSQAGNINPNQTQHLKGVELVKQILAQSGVNAQVLENGNDIQLNFVHQQATVIGNIFQQLSQQGLHIKQLQINQTDVDKIEVQSQLTKN